MKPDAVKRIVLEGIYSAYSYFVIVLASVFIAMTSAAVFPTNSAMPRQSGRAAVLIAGVLAYPTIPANDSAAWQCDTIAASSNAPSGDNMRSCMISFLSCIPMAASGICGVSRGVAAWRPLFVYSCNKARRVGRRFRMGRPPNENASVVGRGCVCCAAPTRPKSDSMHCQSVHFHRSYSISLQYLVVESLKSRLRLC